jgi:hypothetical protein
MNGRLESWPNTAFDSALTIDAGALDLARLQAAAYATSFTVMSFGSSPGRQDFNDASVPVAAWGQAGRLGGSDPRCESNGCMLIGPLANPYCSERSGFAGRIATSSPSIAMRYRVLVGPIVTGSAEVPPFSPPLQFDLAVRGGEISTNTVFVQPTELDPLTEPLGALRWGTGWRTLDTPTMPGDVGYAVYSGTTSCNPPGAGGDAWKMPIAILVDWIAG